MKTVKFGLIGYGAWGRYHAQAIDRAEGAELVAVAARPPETRREAEAEHAGIATYGDYRELLQRDDLDLVDVALPNDLHHPVGLAVLQSGHHLLLEKPMALSAQQCRELAATAAENGLMLAVVHELRLSALWGKVKEMIDAGAIGEPLYALLELWRNPYRQGAGGWRYDANRVGNWILEEPIHFFDLARWYFAGHHGDPQAVYACANAKDPAHPELQDNFSAMLHFADGAYAVISQTLSAFEHHQVVKITGREGALWAHWEGASDRTTTPKFWLKHFDGERLEEIAIAATPGEVFEMEELMRRLVRCRREGIAPPATAQDGLWSTAMCLAAQQSVESGKRVFLQEFVS